MMVHDDYKCQINFYFLSFFGTASSHILYFAFYVFYLPAGCDTLKIPYGDN